MYKCAEMNNNSTFNALFRIKANKINVIHYSIK